MENKCVLEDGHANFKMMMTLGEAMGMRILVSNRHVSHHVSEECINMIFSIW